MVLIKHNYLKSDIFFNSIFIPGFSGSRFFRFLGSGPGSGSRVQVQGPGPGSGSRVKVQVIEAAHFYITYPLLYSMHDFYNLLQYTFFISTNNFFSITQLKQ